ncbi:RtcB family protein [Candidatus Hecatella orcuttiae]|uniref:RtcB family protein n=1 Tax=Candidatus Hecatella orcuttiae TaxID=1935119 RepID=UPI002868273A|nr:RtcB family protein [Candidatus Hecatella orcuttiae]
MAEIPIRKIGEYVWEIPKYRPEMRVSGIVYADSFLLEKMKTDRTLLQCANVATLPGIYKYAITMPDGHEGYGFPIGGVAAADYEEGVISPGGVGYDINCGVRLLKTNLTEKELRPKLPQLLELIFRKVPSGLGSKGKIRLSTHELDEVAREGIEWAVEKGYGWEDDLKRCEESGRMPGADPSKVSNTAKSRGAPELGTLGSGNHFLEIQRIDRVFNPEAAKTLGLQDEGWVTVMIHTGSRGFGHQVCSDYLRIMDRAVRKYGIQLPDRELACTPGQSPEAEDYFKAMASAVNYAFTNRQCITHWVRQAFEEAFGRSAEELGLEVIYDVAHNICKKEEHMVEEGKVRTVWVHRKGATRAFPPDHPALPAGYRAMGQPVLIAGTMGTSSWLLLGTKKAMELSFGSTAHGAGRFMSRSAATRKFGGPQVKEALERRSILIRAASMRVIAEEAPEAYKDVDRVAEVSHQLGIATKVVRLTPLGVVKG